MTDVMGVGYDVLIMDGLVHFDSVVRKAVMDLPVCLNEEMQNQETES